MRPKDPDSEDQQKNKNKMATPNTSPESGKQATPISSPTTAPQLVSTENSNDEVSSSKNTVDVTFEPTIDMMVNDFDDEATLEEEEALAFEEQGDRNDELSNLLKESDMPLKDLLALYNCGSSSPAPPVRIGKRSKKRKIVETMSVPSSSSVVLPDGSATTGGEVPASLPDCENHNKEFLIRRSVKLPIKIRDVPPSVSSSSSSSSASSTSTSSSSSPMAKKPKDTIVDKLIKKNRQLKYINENFKPNSDYEEEKSGGNVVIVIKDDDDEENATAIKSDDISDEEPDEDEDDDDESKGEMSHLVELYPETYRREIAAGNDDFASRASSNQMSDDDDDGNNSDGDDDDDKDDSKRTIMVGSDFQAVIPNGLSKYDDALPYENEDKLVWDPSQLTDTQVEEYLFSAHSILLKRITATESPIPQSIFANQFSSHLRDNEQALYLLLQCGQNTDEAKRRFKINPTLSISTWSEDEAQNFESGIRLYGKDFHSIHKYAVKTRSVDELVNFYYLWKKSSRQDQFAKIAAKQEKIDKRKLNTNPNVTDHMDRFLEEQDGGSPNPTQSPNGSEREYSAYLAPSNTSLLLPRRARQASNGYLATTGSNSRSGRKLKRAATSTLDVPHEKKPQKASKHFSSV